MMRIGIRSRSRALLQAALVALVTLVVVLVTLLVATSCATHAHAAEDVRVHLFTRHAPPVDWVRGEEAPLDTPITFFVALKQRNLDALEATFWAVSDPDHPAYQQYLPIEEIQAIVTPSVLVIDTVSAWLTSHGVTSLSHFSDAIRVTTTTRIASALFSTQFYAFKHVQTGRIVHRALGAYSVPDHIHALIDFVDGLSSFPMPRVSSRSLVSSSPLSSSPSPSNDLVNLTVPAFTTALYELATPRTLAYPNTSHGVIEFENEYFLNSDIVLFNTAANSSLPTVADQHIIGLNENTYPGTEASMDVQWQGAINPGATPWFWIEAGNTWMYGWAVHFMNTTDVPQVVSISYGWWEGDQCTPGATECSQLGVDSLAYVRRVDIEFQKMGVRGVSVLVSSGDSGANGRSNPNCAIPQLRPSYPAVSPYVTSVGATEIHDPVYNLPSPPPVCVTPNTYACFSNGTETAVSYAISAFTSGGGFSNVSSMPEYQKDAVAAYFASGVALPPASYFNAAGRAHPDVSAIGEMGIYAIGGSLSPGGGTSLSSPIFSGVISMLNAIAMQLSGQPLGFVNPLLYKLWAMNRASFHDVTQGDNICTENGCLAGCTGFVATKGWDPVTGLGTPNYAEMAKGVQQVLEQRNQKRSSVQQI